MKNVINYYYNLLTDKIIKTEESYIFFVDKIEYEFIPFYLDTEKVIESYLKLNESHKYCHEIIMNNKNTIITYFNNTPYVLIKKHINIKTKVEASDIINFIVPIQANKKNLWKQLWINKIDYYEYQVSELASKYNLIKESFNYYVGLSETAISLIDYVNFENVYYSVSHIRVSANSSLSEFYNPLFFTIDARTRDVSEYIKSLVFDENKSLKEVEIILDKFMNISNYTKDEVLLLIIRMIYPSYYYDSYDKVIMKDSIDESDLYNITKKSLQYETFLKQVYKKNQKKYGLPIIDWFG